MPTKSVLLVRDLERSLKNPVQLSRYNAIFDFARSEITSDAIPVLLSALSDEYPGVVRCAANALGKLGPAALEYGNQTRAINEVTWALLTAAYHIDPILHLPQAYPDCLEALICIDPKNPFVYGLVRNFISLNNWYHLKASLFALRAIETPQADDLFARAIDFWLPELDKKQKRVVLEIANGDRSKRMSRQTGGTKR